LKEGEETKRGLQGRLDILAHQRDDNENTQKTVNDTGHGGEKVNEELESVGNFLWRELGEKNRGANAEGHSDEESHYCGNHRAIDEGQSAEVLEDGIPDSGEEKVEAKFVASQNGPLPQLEDEQQSDKYNRNSKQKRNQPRDFVAIAEPGKKGARARNRARARNGCGCSRQCARLLDVIDGL
jgi:hypothetical protein